MVTYLWNWLIFSARHVNIVGKFFHSVLNIDNAKGWLIFPARNVNIEGNFFHSVLNIINAKVRAVTVYKGWNLMHLEHVLLIFLYRLFADFDQFLSDFLIWNRAVYI